MILPSYFRIKWSLNVIARYPSIYPEQYEYMMELKTVMETKNQKGHALLEMPTGTGKTMCILAVYMAMRDVYPNMGMCYMESSLIGVGKLIYCTRTISELNQCMEEMKKLVEYRKSVLQSRYNPISGICLSSRRNLCIHRKINTNDAHTFVDISFYQDNVIIASFTIAR